MKKKILLLLILFLIISPKAFCEQDEFDNGYDVFTKQRNLKPVSEQDVQRVMKALEERKQKRAQKKKHWWQKSNKKKKMEGQALTKQGNVNPTGDNVVQRPYLLIQLTDKLLAKNTIIQPGFYTVDFDQAAKNLILKQGYTIVGEVRMLPVKDPNYDDLYYIKTSQDDDCVKFEYGEIENHYEGYCRILK